VGKHFKPALAADAAVRAVTDALAAAGLPGARATAAHEDGRLVITVTGADPGRVRDAVAGFALTLHTGPSPAHRPPRRDPQKGNTTMNHHYPAAQEPVIVVGAGPAGCTAALLLADFGIPVTLLERHAQPHPLPRAVHLDDEVARTLGRIGVSGDSWARSRPGSGLRLLVASHRVMAEFSRDHQASQHGFPQANMFHPGLKDRAEALGGQFTLRAERGGGMSVRAQLPLAR
jgi:FAD binding domain